MHTKSSDNIEFILQDPEMLKIKTSVMVLFMMFGMDPSKSRLLESADTFLKSSCANM